MRNDSVHQVVQCKIYMSQHLIQDLCIGYTRLHSYLLKVHLKDWKILEDGGWGMIRS